MDEDPVEMLCQRLIEERLRFFEYGHLPGHLQAYSRPFYELANQLSSYNPSNWETVKCLDALLVAKDANVRANL